MPVIEASHNAMKTTYSTRIITSYAHAQQGEDDCYGSISSVCLHIYK